MTTKVGFDIAQGEVDGRVLIHCAFNSYHSTVMQFDAHDDGLPNSRPFMFCSAIYTCAYLKYLVGKLHIESNAIFQHKVNARSVAELILDLKDGFRTG